MKKATLPLLTILLTLTGAQQGFKKDNNAPSSTSLREEYQAKDFSHLFGIPGFSDELLKMHFTLYQGYVKNTNLLLSLLKDRTTSSQFYDYQALKRCFGWEFDGMRLHELYFENLGGKKALESSSPLFNLIKRDFGSFENWQKDFIATGMMRGIGWSILYFDSKAGRLMNIWANEHDLGHLAGATPLLVMDIWEHAYITEFGLDRSKYIDAFFKNIDWGVVASRYRE